MKNIFKSFEVESSGGFQRQSKRRGIRRFLFISIAISSFLISLFVGLNVGIKMAAGTDEKQTTNDKWAALDSYCANYDVAVSIYPASLEFSKKTFEILNPEEMFSRPSPNFDDYTLVGYICENEETAKTLTKEYPDLIIEVCDSIYAGAPSRSFPVYTYNFYTDFEYIYVGNLSIAYRFVED